MSRVETDSMGPVEIADEALWGAQTQRAVNNFTLGGGPMPMPFLVALGHVKAAAAVANVAVADLAPQIGNAIVNAAERLCSQELGTQFPVSVFQTGSGTSTNMNANEVLARVASEFTTESVHPNDHVNMSQSSNDVIPTTIHVAASLELEHALLPALAELMVAIDDKAQSLSGLVKTGRTHLMDAMPIEMSQEFSSWRDQLGECNDRLMSALPRLRQLAQGGTAVGTGINAPEDFPQAFASALSERTGIDFRPAGNAFTRIASQDTAVELSGQLKTLAVTLMKIANDLRWMNSGPLMGLAEIQLPELQPGSSIMPGKINPVIPEAVAMVAADVMGNDVAISVAGQSGNFQLNVMLPLIADRLLRSIALLAGACESLNHQCIKGLEVNSERIAQGLARNPILVTALNRVVGYDLGARIAKQAYAQNRPVIDVAAELTELPREMLQALLDPAALARGGMPGTQDS